MGDLSPQRFGACRTGRKKKGQHEGGGGEKRSAWDFDGGRLQIRQIKSRFLCPGETDAHMQEKRDENGTIPRDGPPRGGGGSATKVLVEEVQFNLARRKVVDPERLGP